MKRKATEIQERERDLEKSLPLKLEKGSRSRKPRNGEMIRRSEALRGERGLINP